MTPITPATHPSFFYTDTICGNEYDVPNYITFDLKTRWDKANTEAYRKAKPDECKPDVDEAKFNAWIATDEGAEITDNELKKLLFTPKNGAPPVDPALVPIPTFRKAYNFFDRTLPASTFAPTAAAATTEAPAVTQPV